jgi:large subunit ribosomal protein L25
MNLAAEKRDTQKASALRNAGRIPGVVYSREVNIPVSVSLREFDRVVRSQGSSTLIDLNISGETHSVLVKAVQMNKRRRVPQHVDFYAVQEGVKVTVNVSINFEGTPVGVRDNAGQMDIQRREVQISIIPRLIPHDVELDISALQIGDSLHVADLVKLLPPEAEILDDLELALIAIVPPRIAEEEVEVSEESEPEVIGREAEGEEGEGEEG